MYEKRVISRMTDLSPDKMRRIVFALFVMLVPAEVSRAGDLPVSGMPVAELRIFDLAMQDFMALRGIEAGLLGIMKDGCIVYERGFGWKTKNHSVVLPEDAMMRMASTTKPITAAAIKILAASGAISLDDYVFDLGQNPNGGILAITPWVTLGDPRLADITVQHLIDHRGGWDRAPPVGDLTYMEVRIALEMLVFSPPGRVNTVRWIMHQPLQVEPGSERHYSNIGYLLLGLILEQESGQDYMTYVRRNVFGPIAGESGTDVELGRTFAADQNPREPWYDDDLFATNVFDPFGLPVLRPYGSWDHEARVSQGRLIGATEPLLKFLDHYYVNGPNIGEPLAGARSTNWHGGLLKGGTRAVLRQRNDGVNYAVIFNRREPGGELEEAGYWDQAFVTMIDDIVDNGIFTWPSRAGRCVDGLWVDFSQAASGSGNFASPLRTVAEALAKTPPEGRIQIKPGNSTWMGTISQPVTLNAPLGLISIGE